MEDDGAIREGGEKRGKVSDVAVYDFGRGRKCGEITGGSDYDFNGVTLPVEGIT